MSLAGTREALGLTAAKPAIPFFLGSLIKDHEKPSATVVQGAGEKTVSFDFGEELDSPKFLDEHPAVTAAGAMPASREQDSEDLHLLEISDEEIDLLIEEGETGGTGGPGGAGDAGNFIPEFDASSLPGLSKAGESPKQAVPVGAPDAAPDAAPNDEALQIELSDKDLEALLTELEHSSSATAKKAPDPKPGPGSEEAE